jgi:hypothetical protein
MSCKKRKEDNELEKEDHELQRRKILSCRRKMNSIKWKIKRRRRKQRAAEIRLNELQMEERDAKAR